MKLAIMQPYIFPYIGYFQLIRAVDKFIILDDVNFIMRGWINRNRILIKDKEYLFSIPIEKASQNKLILECEIGENRWKSKFLKTLELNYKNAPFYKESYKIISTIIISEEKNLSKWLSFQIRTLCDYFEISTEIVHSSIKYNNQHLKAQDRIIDICKKEKAVYYFNPIGGIKLYDSVAFSNVGIKLYFLKTLPIKYKQFNSDFIPSLSIIDIMMFNNVKDIITQLSKFELI